MDTKCLIKFSHEDHTDLMHYAIYEGDVVVLSKRESNKVPYAKEHGELDVAFDVDGKKYDTLKVDVIEDLDYVGEVYQYMIETDNAYFTDGYKDLVVMKLYK